MMSAEKMREEFAEAYHEQFGRKPQNWNADLGKYMDAHAQGAWWGWKASRAAMVIELPSPLTAPPYASYEGGWNDMREEATDAIEAAGAKVVP